MFLSLLWPLSSVAVTGESFGSSDKASPINLSACIHVQCFIFRFVLFYCCADVD